MAQTITLIPLLCPNCRAALEAQPDEVAWRCAQCGQGWQLNEDHGDFGLEPLALNFQAGLDPRTHGRPFWTASARITLQRETYSGNQARQAQEYWAAPRRFFVPAYTCPLETLIRLGADLLREPPALQAGPPAPFAAVTLPRADVADMIQFVVVGIEAERKDQLKSISVQVQMEPPELWILP